MEEKKDKKKKKTIGRILLRLLNSLTEVSRWALEASKVPPSLWEEFGDSVPDRWYDCGRLN